MDISDMIDWGSVTNLNHGAPPSHRLNTALHSQLEMVLDLVTTPIFDCGVLLNIFLACMFINMTQQQNKF